VQKEKGKKEKRLNMIDKAFLDTIRKRTIDTLKFDTEQETQGIALHKESIVCDSLAEPPQPLTPQLVELIHTLIDEGVERRGIGERTEKLRQKLIKEDPAYKAEYASAWDMSGVTCISSTQGTTDLLSSVKRISETKYAMDLHDDIVTKATRADDIRKAKRDGKHAIIWNLQNTLPFGGGVDHEKELDNIDFFYKLGVRIVQLTYNLRNFVGDGCTERYESGLTNFGVKVIERMNQLGILVDTSHCGYQTTLDAVEFSKDSVAATHTGCKEVYWHTRSKTDEELQAIAEKGGFIGVYLEQGFLGGQGTLKEALDHIDYLVNLVGIDHVGIGTDLAHARSTDKIKAAKEEEEAKMKSIPLLSPETKRFWLGWHPEKPTYHYNITDNMIKGERNEGSLAWINWPYYTVGLVTRGYSDQEIQKIIGGNFLRIVEMVIG